MLFHVRGRVMVDLALLVAVLALAQVLAALGLATALLASAAIAAAGLLALAGRLSAALLTLTAARGRALGAAGLAVLLQTPVVLRVLDVALLSRCHDC